MSEQQSENQSIPVTPREVDVLSLMLQQTAAMPGHTAGQIHILAGLLLKLERAESGFGPKAFKSKKRAQFEQRSQMQDDEYVDGENLGNVPAHPTERAAQARATMRGRG